MAFHLHRAELLQHRRAVDRKILAVENRRLQPGLCKQTLASATAGPLVCQKPTMVDADDLPPKPLECLTRATPRRGYRAGSAARSGTVLSRRSMASADHLNLKLSRLSLLIDRQPISFMSRSISL